MRSLTLGVSPLPALALLLALLSPLSAHAQGGGFGLGPAQGSGGSSGTAGASFTADPLVLDDGAGNQTYLFVNGADGYVGVGSADGTIDGFLYAAALYRASGNITLSATSGNVNIESLQVGGAAVTLRGAGYYRLGSSGTVDWMDNADGGAGTRVLALAYDSAAGALKVYDPSASAAAAVRAYDADASDYASLSHDGSNATISDGAVVCAFFDGTGNNLLNRNTNLNGKTLFGSLRVVEAHTEVAASPHVLNVSADNTAVLTNEGATAENHHDLPSAATGMTYTFYVQDADGIQINAATGDTIRIAGTVSASAGFISSTTVGDSITLVAINATEWVAVCVGGNNWTFDT